MRRDLHAMTGNKKQGSRCFNSDSLLGGGYLLSHFRSTIGVVRLNFSVRNGKRWDPHAMTTLVPLFRPEPVPALRAAAGDASRHAMTKGNATRRSVALSQSLEQTSALQTGKAGGCAPARD